jgi:hypothetical protein
MIKGRVAVLATKWILALLFVSSCLCFGVPPLSAAG